MRTLTQWTAGLVGERDPAQPLLTLHDPAGRVELSGATTANWVAKTANLLVDELDHPSRVGLLIPLHWQGLAVLLAGVATEATVVVAGDVAGLEGCEIAFVVADRAADALALGLDEVLVLSGTPLGAPVAALPAGAVDYARVVPGHGDSWGGPVPSRLDVEVRGEVLPPLPELELGPADRVLAAVDPADPGALAALLAVLRAGAALVLAPSPAALDLPRIVASEGVTATLGLAVEGTRSVDSALRSSGRGVTRSE